MHPKDLHSFKLRLRRLWMLNPERLWLASIAMQRRGHWVLAFWLKQLNTFLYHNSLAPRASVSPDIFLGHNSLGVVINGNVEIGRHVIIWHNVTLAGRIIVEDWITIGASAVVIAPHGRTLRIGPHSRIGAGAVVTHDVPPRTTVVQQPARMITREPISRTSGGEDPSGFEREDPSGLERAL